MRTLANLAVEPSNRAALGAHLPAAAAALGSSSDLELTQASLRLLVNLSYDPPIRAAMLALPELVGALLRSCASPAEAIQHEAVLCVVNLTLDEGAEPVLIAAGALPPLVAILRSGSAGLQEQVRPLRPSQSRRSPCRIPLQPAPARTPGAPRPPTGACSLLSARPSPRLLTSARCRPRGRCPT